MRVLAQMLLKVYMTLPASIFTKLHFSVSNDHRVARRLPCECAQEFDSAQESYAKVFGRVSPALFSPVLIS